MKYLYRYNTQGIQNHHIYPTVPYHLDQMVNFKLLSDTFIDNAFENIILE